MFQHQQHVLNIQQHHLFLCQLFRFVLHIPKEVCRAEEARKKFGLVKIMDEHQLLQQFFLKIFQFPSR
jgi:hypothetical protein